MSWETVRLGDFITLKRGYDLPTGKRKEGTVPVVSSSGVTGHHNVAKLEGPGVVTGRYGTLGQVYFIDEPYWPLNTALYVQDFKGNDPRFTSYFLRRVLRGAVSDKAAVPGVNRNDLHGREVRVTTDTVEQRRIASILSAYDDLIENHRRRIQLLEEVARLLYKEWFVQLWFPGHEQVKVVDGVPEGWERTFVPDVITVNPKEPSKDATIRYVPMSALSTTGMTVDQALVEVRDKSTSVRFRNGDTLFARITPCLENGKTAFTNFLDDNEVACGSTEFIVLRGTRVSPFFTYCLARTHHFRGNAIKSMVGSSGRQRVQTSCFTEFLMPLPPRVLLKAFDDYCGPLFGQIENLQQQQGRLAAARDIFLPRLMNGGLAT